MLPTVLIVDDDVDILAACQFVLQSLPCRVETASSVKALPAALQTQSLAVIVLDMNFRRGDTSSAEGLRWLAEIRRTNLNVIVIVMTAHADVNIAVTAIKQGASDFIAKPWQPAQLVTAVRQGLQLFDARKNSSPTQAASTPILAASGSELVGESSAMRHLRSLIARVGPTDANVLIVGENGTGKELVARALHQASPRSITGPWISVDLGAVAAQLFESELFGHKRGSFTDAKTDREGRLAAAHTGTLFLDEIGNLPLTLQPKLLTALEQRKVVPIGENTPTAIDVRIISATNLTQQELTDGKVFRPDLLFRLNTLVIEVPPLRERREDVALIAQHYAQHYCERYRKPQKAISDAALERLASHDWPGNVRALRHAIERAVILSEGAMIDVADFALPQTATSAAHAPAEPATPNDDLNLDRMEKTLIEQALKRHAWNISLAAKALGLSRAALYRRMERHGL
jgi:DNA-binding NtrC family response regulator